MSEQAKRGADEWVVGSLMRDGRVGVHSAAKRYPNREFAEAAAYDRRREKPFMDFIAVPALTTPEAK